MSVRQTISAEEETQAKPWRLPYWTEPPAFQADTEQTEQTESQATETLSKVSLPSVEELENIRRDAYNDGLEQGLIEGRQKGHQEGLAQGLEAGKQEGIAIGQSEGYAQGLERGEQAGKEQALAEFAPISERLNQLVEQLQSRVLERDVQLPNTITLLVMAVCEQVLRHELKAGTANIHKFVQTALKQLPEGAENVQVQLAKQDYEQLQQALTQRKEVLNLQVNDDLEVGVCKIKTSQSLVEYSAYEHLQQVLEPLAKQLLKAVDAEQSAYAEQIVLNDTSNPIEATQAQDGELTDVSPTDEMQDNAPTDEIQDDAQTQPPMA